MKLIYTVFWSAFAVIIRLASGFISVKFVAVIIGPLGIALIGQFGNFTSIIMTIASGGVSSGIVKYTSQYKGNVEELKKIWYTVSFVSGLLILPIIIILLLLHNWLAQEFLHDSRYGSIIIVFALTLCFYVANSFVLNVLNGRHQIKTFNLLNSLNSVLGLLLTLALVYYYQVYGALLAIVISQSVTFFVILYFVRRHDWFRFSHFFGNFDKFYFKKLLGFTTMSLTSMCIIPTSQMFIRSYLASHTSWDVAGYWQGMQRISDSYLMIIYMALGTYFLPKLACLEDTNQIKSEIYRGYKLILPFVVGSALLIYFVRDFIIHLLFAKSFMPMRDMFFWQLVGDCFKVASYIVAYLMLAKAKIKIYIITETIFGASLVLLSYWFINLFGSNGAVMAFAINYAIYFIVFMFLYKKGCLF
jgi:PST family polysaccharide transporter